NVAIPYSVLQEKAARVTARRKRAMLQIQHQSGLSVGIRTLDPHLPWTVLRRLIGAQIAAEIDEKRSLVARRKQLVGPINGIFLADPTEIQFHSGRQRKARRKPS